MPTPLRARILFALAAAPDQSRAESGVANAGNVPLSNIRLESTDLVATSGTGLRIRNELISFLPQIVNTVALGDTQRVFVSFRIPTGLLAGPHWGYHCTGDSVSGIRIPFTVVFKHPAIWCSRRTP